MTTDKPSAGDTRPRVADNDAGEISVAFNGKELRGWSYKDDAERRIKMLAAREYVEGWCDGRDAIALAPPVAERGATKPEVCDDCGKPVGSNGDKCFSCFVYNEESMPVAERGGGGAQTSPVIPSRKKLAEIIDAAWKKNGSVPFPLYLSELEWIANDIYEALSSHPSTVPTPTPETGDGSDTRPERGGGR